MIAAAPEQITSVITAADNMGMSENPLVSGSWLEGEELLVALELGLAEAGALVVVEAEALEAGLAAALSSTPRLFMPLSSKPRSWARRACVPLSSLADGEALLIALGEAVEVGLAGALSSTPRLFAPLSSKPRSWARRACVPLSSKPLSSLAEGEALADALDEAEAVETGLAVASSMPRSSKPRSSIPRSSIPRSSVPRASMPLSSAPLSSEWAAATGAKTNTANATERTSNTDLRTVSPRFRLYDEDKDATRKAARPMQIYGYFPSVVPEGSIGESNFRAAPCVCKADQGPVFRWVGRGG